MRPLHIPASRRLHWSRWLVLALMGLCLPLQGVLAVTMQMTMRMTMPSGIAAASPVDATHGTHAGHAGNVGHIDNAGHTGHAAHVAHADRGATAIAVAPQAGQAFMASHHGHAAARDVGSLPPCHDDPGNGACTDMAGHTDSHSPHHDTHHGCSFCAQCCIGAAIPMAPLTVAHATPAETPPVAAPAVVLERQPQALDRPPKPLLA